MSMKLNPTLFIIIPILVLCSWNIIALQDIMDKTEKMKSDPYQPGRYQIVHNAEFRRDTFLLDTATGETWIAGGDQNGFTTGWDKLDHD